jgi:hypothetical protein
MKFFFVPHKKIQPFKTDANKGVSALLFFHLPLFISRFSIYIALVILVISFLADLHYGEDIFQRAGSVVVGLALLHYFEVSRLESESNYRFKFLNESNIPQVHGDLLNPRNEEEFLLSTNLHTVITINFGSFGSHHNNEFHVMPRDSRIALAFLVHRKYWEIQDIREVRQTIGSKEMLLAVVGTLIWGYGDWMVNFFVHCESWKLWCS